MMNIQEACKAFQILLEEQQARIANMSTEKVDFSSKECVTIGIVDGDGIGPLIMEHAVAVLEKLLADETETYGLQLELAEEDLLRLSSARVDRELYSGCDIYVTKYVMDFQDATQKDYPVNPDVFTLMQWDPNILSLFTVESEQEKRELINALFGEE